MLTSLPQRLIGDSDLAETLFKSLPTSQLEKRLEEIDDQLENLASFSLRGGIGAIGYRSYWNDELQWIEIELDGTYPIDEIVLVPCLWRHPKTGFQPDAFPAKLRILAGDNTNKESTLITEYTQTIGTEQTVAPLVLPISQINASWIRIEATELNKRHFDGHKVLQLSEVLVFSGTSNVALHRPVTCSSSDQRGIVGAWNKSFLVDGFTPYLMDSSKGTSSNAFIATTGKKPELILDLGANYSISRIHMHAVEQGDTVPQAYAGDLGIPRRMLIKGSKLADFSDAVTLIDYKTENINETGPIIMLDIPDTVCRYVQFIHLRTETQPELLENPPRLGFAEIEIFSEGENVALRKPVLYKDLSFGNRALSSLTDGNNLYGTILPIRTWMNELATRGAIEAEQPRIIAEMNQRYASQKRLLILMMQLVVFLAFGICLTYLIERHRRLRQLSLVRERIAADFHDELGANIHTIGLISDMAKNALHSPKELEELLDQIREFTNRSGEAARYCTNILEARGVCEDLVEEMTQFANRILADLEHDFSVEGKDLLKTLPSHKRIDLLLFYKECLTNILRHSSASKVKTKLTANRSSITMKVSDNGIGLDTSNREKTPHSLKRRAKLLRANIVTEQSATGGTRITLKLKTRKFRFIK